MIDKFCEYLTNKIKNEIPDVDEVRAEAIMYGLQLIIGELPKLFIMLVISAVFGIFLETLMAFFFILPYKVFSGGFHLKTHIGCFLGTVVFYCGNAVVSKGIELPSNLKICLILFNLIFGIIMISKYAPADTINVPILTKKERKIKKIFSYIFLIVNMLVAIIVSSKTISNILLFGTLVQTFSITRLVYWLTKNQYGYEVYMKENIESI